MFKNLSMSGFLRLNPERAEIKKYGSLIELRFFEWRLSRLEEKSGCAKPGFFIKSLKSAAIYHADCPSRPSRIIIQRTDGHLSLLMTKLKR